MITVFGAANWDLFFPVADLPARDTALFLDTYHSAPGGKGVNQAIAAKIFASLGGGIPLMPAHACAAFELSPDHHVFSLIA
jgi:hypothetical protein